MFARSKLCVFDVTTVRDSDTPIHATDSTLTHAFSLRAHSRRGECGTPLRASERVSLIFSCPTCTCWLGFASPRLCTSGMVLRKRARPAQDKTSGTGVAKGAPPCVAAWLVAAFATVAGVVMWGQPRAAHANISSLTGKVLSRTGQLMSEHSLQAALENAQQHNNRSGEHPELGTIMAEVSEGLQKRVSGQPTAPRRMQLTGLGGPLGDALASVAWDTRPQGKPFRFHRRFEAHVLPLPLQWPREASAGEPRPEATLLSARPMVVMVDNWLSRVANASLDRLPAEFDAAMASAVQPATTPQSLGTAPNLCFRDGPEHRQFSDAVTRCVEEAVAAADEGRPHCVATAALGRRQGGPLSAFKMRGGQPGSKCGPLTKGLQEALVRSENVLFDPGASDTVDAIDGAISAMLGFDFDADTVAAPGGLASFLMNASLSARAAVRDAYDFSTGPQLSRYRATRQGGYRLHTDCHDFGLSEPTERTHTAILYVSEPQGGGETTFPALGLRVEPRRGRLLLFENLLPDGTCDPRTAHASSDVHLNASADKLVLQKWFYLDRAYGEYLRTSVWHEGKPRQAGTTVCFKTDCRTQERAVGDAKTLALLKSGKDSKRKDPPVFS